MSKANESAFPCLDNEPNIGLVLAERGMSLRTYLAGQAMMGLLASWGNHDVTAFDEIAHDAVKAADELIQALEKTEK
jgi:hypothetical protein